MIRKVDIPRRSPVKYIKSKSKCYQKLKSEEPELSEGSETSARLLLLDF